MERLSANSAKFHFYNMTSAMVKSGLRLSGIIIFIFVSAFSCFNENIIQKVKYYNTEGAINILSVTPANSAVNIPLSASIVVKFDDNINMLTVDPATFIVNDGTGPMSGSLSYDPASRSVTFIPSTGFMDNTAYSVLLTTGIKNMDGYSMTADYSWSFTTAFYVKVIAITPANGEANVSLNSDISVEFNDNIDMLTVNDMSTFLVDAGSGPISGTFTSGLKTVIFSPAGGFTTGAHYTVKLTNGIKNMLGESMIADYTTVFDTVTSLSQPEIYVLSPLSEIFTGDTFDFGSSIAPIAFTIGNNGDAGLNIPASGISLLYGTDFTVVATPVTPKTIPAGTSELNSFTVTFNPSGAGVRNDVLTIISNDSDEGSFVINLTGVQLTVPAPEIQITNSGTILVSGTGNVNFGTFSVGNAGDLTLTLYNIGSADLIIGSISIIGNNPESFSIGPVSPLLVSGTTAPVVLHFSPAVTGNLRAEVIIPNNDSNENPFIIKVRGRGK